MAVSLLTTRATCRPRASGDTAALLLLRRNETYVVSSERQ